MASPTNVLLLFHGITREAGPYSPTPTYESFWNALAAGQPGLKKNISKQIFISWGHESPESGENLRDDEKLTQVQEVLRRRVAYDRVRKDPGANNVILSGCYGRDWGWPGLRSLFRFLREDFVLRGFGDAIYYCSLDGERAVRAAVYDQALRELDDILDAPDVRFHIFGHSLGVTLSHDFLYGLFAPEHRPDFVGQRQGSKEACERFVKWREKARMGHLRLGSLASAASQLPLFHLRKQDVVDTFFGGGFLDPGRIGLASEGRIQWKLFYDVDDVLGFPTRNLYRPNETIKEIQVNCGSLPGSAHSGYWTNRTVLRETADLIWENSR